MFLKNYNKHILDNSKKYDNEEKADIIKEIRRTGGDYLYDILYSKLIRNNLIDEESSEIKNNFYNKKLLCCCVSIRKLSNISGIANQKIQKLLNMMEEAGWIVKHKKLAQRSKTVYVLGEFIYDNGNYIETLYRHKVLDSIVNKKVEEEHLSKYEKLYFKREEINNQKTINFLHNCGN
jgi:predicted transcriptional regulator